MVLAVAVQLVGCGSAHPYGRPYHQSYSQHIYDGESNKGKSELSVSYGRFSGTQLVMAGPGPVNDDVPGAVQTANSGNFFATYRYYFTNRLALGLTVGGQKLEYDWFGTGYPQLGYECHEKMNIIAAAIEMKNVLAYSPGFQFYDVVGVGASQRTGSFGDFLPGGYSYYRTPQSSTKFNLQISPVCLRFGRNIGGYIELGMGYKGLVNGGLFYAF